MTKTTARNPWLIEAASGEIVAGTDLIHQAILSAAAALPDIPKDGKLEFNSNSYNFRRADDINAALRGVLIQYGITYYPTLLKADHQLQVATEPWTQAQIDPETKLVIPTGRPVHDGRVPTTRSWAVVEYELRFVHVGDGSEVMASAAGLAYDTNSDKAIGKATTAALKRIITTVFQITDHVEGDLEEEDVESKNRPATTDRLVGDRGAQQREAAGAASGGSTRRSGPSRAAKPPAEPAAAEEPTINAATGEVVEPDAPAEPSRLQKAKDRVRAAATKLELDPATVNAIATEVTGKATRQEWIVLPTAVEKLATELEKRVAAKS